MSSTSDESPAPVLSISPVVWILHRQLCAAIDGRRLVSFVYQGRRRIAEPHDYGLTGGRPTLFFYQVGGESRSGKPFGWRQAHVPEVTAFRALERSFPGPRPASGRHIPWERLYASVSRPEQAHPG